MKKTITTLEKDKFEVYKKFIKKQYTGILVLEDGSYFYGYVFGYQGSIIG